VGEAVVHIEAVSTANGHQVARHERLGFVHTFPKDAFVFGDRFGEGVRRQESYGCMKIDRIVFTIVSSRMVGLAYKSIEDRNPSFKSANSIARISQK
jgi:hypothetical protein